MLGEETESNREMGFFRKLFGGSREPEKPDVKYLVSKVASTY